jgi:hypothetical protein
VRVFATLNPLVYALKVIIAMGARRFRINTKLILDTTAMKAQVVPPLVHRELTTQDIIKEKMVACLVPRDTTALLKVKIRIPLTLAPSVITVPRARLLQQVVTRVLTPML